MKFRLEFDVPERERAENRNDAIAEILTENAATIARQLRRNLSGSIWGHDNRKIGTWTLEKPESTDV